MAGQLKRMLQASRISPFLNGIKISVQKVGFCVKSGSFRTTIILKSGAEMSLKPVSAVLRLAVFVFSLSILSGCDDARQKIASAISPATAAEVTANVSRQIGAGQFQQAIDEGERYLAGNADASGKLAWELAKASAQANDADRAVRYASAAIKAGAASSVDLMSEPLLEPVRTDLRLVSLAAGMSPGSEGAAAAPAAQAQQPAATGDAQATIGEQGVSASAGDVSVKLPD